MAGQLTIGSTPIYLKQGDITDEQVDAIVNAANSGLMGGGGVDGAIHRAAGPTLLEECKALRQTDKYREGLPPGQAVATGAGNLQAKRVIHTVGPVWHGGRSNEPEILRSCYENSLQVARTGGDEIIAFPAISTGVYGYPIAEAALVALQAVADDINKNGDLKEVRFVLFSQDALRAFQAAAAQIIQ